jgi:signal transduction histidine kinase
MKRESTRRPIQDIAAPPQRARKLNRARTDRRRLEEALQESQANLEAFLKTAALGVLIVNAEGRILTTNTKLAREVNNPLAIISSRIDVMLADAEAQNLPPEFLEDLKVVQRNALRVARIAHALRSFARQSPGEREPLDLNAVVEETLLLVRKPMTVEGVRITAALDPTLRSILGNSDTLQQVLLNLLTNAREAMVGGGEIRIETGPVPDRPDWVRVVVSDTGPGIAPEDLPRIFDPFYTTKAEGTGLGLPISYRIVQEHQGTVDVQSEPGRGTTFILGFPGLPRGPQAA